MPKAYSYIRFSSAKQELGDSLRRQEKLARDYACEHALDLDTSSYRDLGISAFKGKNASEGKLKLFLDAVDAGLIDKGSFLLVESLDRLSRTEVQEALEQLLSIIKRDITVVTLLDRQVYSRKTIQSDRGISLIISISHMARAHDESATKSVRVKEAWKAKRERGGILTGMAPAWLRLNADRKGWLKVPEKVQVVRHIFDLASQGLGSPSIARQLNAEGVATMARASNWTFGTVAAILKNEAVIGRYSPKKADAEPINGYFPEIISPTTFRLVQEGMRNRRWLGGRNTANITNLFAGLCFCYKCSSPMRVVGSNGRHIYLKCLSAYSNSGCSEGRFPYLATEKAVLSKMADDLSYIMARRTSAENPLPALEMKRDDLKGRISKLTDALEVAPDVNEFAKRIADLGRDLTSVESAISAVVLPSDYTRDRQDLGELYQFFRNEIGEMPLEVRRRVQNFLRQIIQDIQFWCDAENDRPTVAVNFKDEYSTDTLYVDIAPWREKVGGSRLNKPQPAPSP